MYAAVTQRKHPRVRPNLWVAHDGVNKLPARAGACPHACKHAARYRGLRASSTRVLVLPGFFAGDGQGHTVLLGRGGSDWSAAIAAAAIDARLCEIWTDVDGIYSADPRLDPTAVKLTHVSHFEILNKGLKVMDSTAITFCMDNKLPIVVFDLMEPGNIRAVLEGNPIGTLVSS